jgi:hypothetical protein
MLDLDRFVGIAENEAVLWNICSKIGDTGPTDAGRKDGDLTQCYPAKPGIDAYGVPYGDLGRMTYKGYAIVQVEATKKEIRKLFKSPAKNSEAYRRKCENYSFIDLDEVFTLGEMIHYRNHDKHVPIVKNFDIKKIKNYKDHPERHDKPHIHGSVTSGTYSITGDYADLKLAMDDVGAVGSNTLEFVINNANSPGANIDFDKVTNSDGLIWVHSTKYGFRSNPLTTGSGKWYQFDGRCNVLIEDFMVNGISFHYDDPTSGSTGRTHTFRRIVFDRTTNHDPLYTNIDNPGTPITIKFYGNLILGRSTASGGRATDVPVGSNWTTPIWNANFFIENNTIIADRNYADAIVTVSGASINPVFRNNVVYGSVGTNAWKESVNKVILNNCARNLALSGTFTENDCITDLVAGDLKSVTIAETDCGKIATNSRLYAAGDSTAIWPNSERDLIGEYIPDDGISMGAFQAGTRESGTPSTIGKDLTYNAQFMARYRIDRGDWTPWLNYNLGDKGDRDPYLTIHNLGIGREIEFEVAETDAVEHIFTDMNIIAKVLGR